MKIDPIVLMMAIVLACGCVAFGMLLVLGFREIAMLVFP